MGLLRRPGSVVWALLMVATIVTTWGLAKDNFDPKWSTAAIFVIAAIKVRMVLMHFMELNHAPTPVRLVFEAWVAVVTIGVVGVYLMPQVAA